MNRAAGPEAPFKLPSRTATSKVRVPSASWGDLSVTTASLTLDPSPPSIDTVALGGSAAKLFLSASHCLMNCSVVTWPAARTGRSAKTITFAATPDKVSFVPLSVAPAELTTASEGTGPVDLTCPIVLSSGTCGFTPESWENATLGASNRLPARRVRERGVFRDMIISFDNAECLRIEREDGLPVPLHVDHGPTVQRRGIECLVEVADLRLAIVGIFPLGIGV